MLKAQWWPLPLVLAAAAAACDDGGAGGGIAPEDPGRPEATAPTEAGAIGAADAAQSLTDIPNNFPFLNSTGKVATFSTEGSVDLGNEFFDNFGTNGRTCGTCHAAQQAWSVSSRDIQLRFDLSGGLDPIFRLVDGANSPNANVSTVQARRQAYSMLLNRGVIRVGLPVPAGAEFELQAVDDPYGFASAAELSLFRRPLVSSNLDFHRQVMWDGRETQADFRAALAAQADHATTGHAQASAPLPAAAQDSIVDFETALFAAQLVDNRVGRLDQAGGRGGPQALSAQANVAAPFDLYGAWATASGGDPVNAGRRAIARGQALFNNPNAGVGGGACRGCHDVSNVGSNSIGIFFDVGVSAGARRTPDQPLYTLRNKATGQTIQTTDPGRGLVTGLWADVNRFKAPSLRGLSARAPYFHNGSARTLEEVVTFYEQSLGFAFSPAEEADLVAFLKAL